MNAPFITPKRLEANKSAFEGEQFSFPSERDAGWAEREPVGGALNGGPPPSGWKIYEGHVSLERRMNVTSNSSDAGAFSFSLQQRRNLRPAAGRWRSSR